VSRESGEGKGGVRVSGFRVERGRQRGEKRGSGLKRCGS